MNLSRFAAGLCLALPLLAASATPAAADWHLTGFVGFTFGADTHFALGEGAGNRRRVWGASASRIGRGILHAEAEVNHVPRFFGLDRADPGDAPPLPLAGRSLTTLTGNLVLTPPLRWTGYSLRPYVSGGPGLLRVRIGDPVLGVNHTLPAINVGGGAYAFASDHVGVRGDLRYFRNLRGSDASDADSIGGTHLHFWRAAVGVIVRY